MEDTKHFRAVSKGFPLKKALFHKHFIRRIMTCKNIISSLRTKNTVFAFPLGAGKKQNQSLKIRKIGGIINPRKSAISQQFMIMLQIILAIKFKCKRFSWPFSVKKRHSMNIFYKKGDFLQWNKFIKDTPFLTL